MTDGRPRHLESRVEENHTARLPTEQPEGGRRPRLGRDARPAEGPALVESSAGRALRAAFTKVRPRVRRSLPRIPNSRDRKPTLLASSDAERRTRVSCRPPQRPWAVPRICHRPQASARRRVPVRLVVRQEQQPCIDRRAAGVAQPGPRKAPSRTRTARMPGPPHESVASSIPDRCSGQARTHFPIHEPLVTSRAEPIGDGPPTPARTPDEAGAPIS